MKTKNILLSAIAASTIFVFGAQFNNANASSKATPQLYRGNWYMYTKPNYAKTIVLKDRVIFQTVKPENVNKSINGNYTLKPGKNGGQKAKYFRFDADKSFENGLDIWTKKMKIDGKYQTVLIEHELMGGHAVFTKTPIKHNYSY